MIYQIMLFQILLTFFYSCILYKYKANKWENMVLIKMK